MVWPTACQAESRGLGPGLAQFFGINMRNSICNLRLHTFANQLNCVCELPNPHFARAGTSAQSILLWEETCSQLWDLYKPDDDAIHQSIRQLRILQQFSEMHERSYQLCNHIQPITTVKRLEKSDKNALESKGTIQTYRWEERACKSNYKVYMDIRRVKN